MRTKLACFATSTATTLAAHAGGPVSWANPTDGDWNLATNWSPAVIPGENNGVTLGHTGTYTVNLGSSNQSAASLTLMNPNATLRITPSRTLTLFGSVGNAGRIAVNPDNNAFTTVLTFASDATLMGIGEILLGGPSTRAQLNASVGATVTNSQGHTIRGVGRITAPLINHGEIIADSPIGELLLSTGEKSNSATWRAIGEGTLALSGFTLDQTPDALILSDGPDSRVTIAGMTINLGTLRSVNNGIVDFIGSSTTIDSVTLEGDVTITAGRTITARETLTNHAGLVINPNNTAFTTTLTTGDDLLIHGDGEIFLGGTASRAQITASGGATITHAQGHTIRGTGRITAPLINHGELIADSTVGPMVLSGGNKSTTTDIRAVNGGTLELTGFTLDLAPDLALTADGSDSSITMNGMTINNGTIRSTNGATIAFAGSSTTIDSVTLEGDVTIVAGRTITARNTLTNHAPIVMNPKNSGFTTTLTTGGSDLLIEGHGEIFLGGTTSRAQITASGGWSVIHAQGHTIRGAGRITAPLINHGELIADSTVGPMVLSGGNKTTTTDIRAVDGGSLELIGFTLDLAPGLAVSADGPDGSITITGMTINNGSIRSTNGATIAFASTSSTIDSVTLEGDVTIVAGRTITARNTLTNHAPIVMNLNNNPFTTTLTAGADDLLIDGGGEIFLGGVATRAQITASGSATVTHGEDHTIRGAGRIAAPLINHGAIEPGTPDDPVAVMQATRPVTNTASARLSVNVAEDQISGRIESTSDFHADGTLDVTFVDGFDPPLGWVASVVTTSANGVSGAFHTVNAPQPTDPRLEFRVVYDTDEIRVGAFCVADINSDGLLNFFDVSAFIALYNAQDPAADIAPPFGVWNFFDIAEFIARYNAGCP